MVDIKRMNHCFGGYIKGIWLISAVFVSIKWRSSFPSGIFLWGSYRSSYPPHSPDVSIYCISSLPPSLSSQISSSPPPSRSQITTLRWSSICRHSRTSLHRPSYLIFGSSSWLLCRCWVLPHLSSKFCWYHLLQSWTQGLGCSRRNLHRWENHLKTSNSLSYCGYNIGTDWSECYAGNQKQPDILGDPLKQPSSWSHSHSEYTHSN